MGAKGPNQDAWMRRLRGRFLVFDGPDGSGKTTQLNHLVSAAQGVGLSVCPVREPGGTPIGEHIRHVLLDHGTGEIAVRCEMLLYMASRAQLCAEIIRPALARGELVVADRFVSSTLAYQGTAGGLSQGEIRAVARVATEDTTPDLVVVFDADERAAAGRLSPLLDRMEAKGAEFHRRVREGYLQQVRDDPDHYALIDASHGPDEVWAQVRRMLDERSRGWA